MSRFKEQNEQGASKLDESFKETLVRVRSYVVELTSRETAQLCKVWLDKLNIASKQRRLRNEYLVELCKQLKSGRIEGIFSRPPPSGLLLPLPKSYHMVCISSSLSDVTEYPARTHRSFKTSAKCIQHRSNTPSRHHPMENTNTSRCSHAINISPSVCFHDGKIMCENQMLSYKHRIDMLNGIVAQLQEQNDCLKVQVLRYRESGKNNEQLYSNINQLKSEIAMLKAKLIDVETEKDALQTSHKEVVEQYQSNATEEFAVLKHQLREAQLKNEALENHVAVLAEKLQEIIHGKDGDTKAMEKHWMNKLKIICQQYDSLMNEKSKELQMKQELLEKKDFELSQKDEERKQEIEMLTNKIQDLEAKLETKIKDEGKLQVIIKEEFCKMKSEMDLATQRDNQNLMSQISALKKAIVKLEKSKEKLGHSYEKKISLMMKNKDFEIQSLQIQLQGQKNELSTSLNSEKQCEIDNAVASLEEQYRKIVGNVEADAENRIQGYLRKIAVLEDEVLSLRRY